MKAGFSIKCKDRLSGSEQHYFEKHQFDCEDALLCIKS